MIGRAFLEWNSTIGVTVEAWRVLSTSQVVCSGVCKKVHSLDGDCAHRDNRGRPLCDNVGMGRMPVIELSEDENKNAPVNKGKGRMYDDI
jgi:hypothetical protein